MPHTKTRLRYFHRLHPAAVLLLVSAAALAQGIQPAVALQFGQVRRIASPDGQATLLAGVRSTGQSSCPALHLRIGRSAASRQVLPVCRTAVVGWASHSKAFFVNDEVASDSTLSYVFDVPSLRRTDVAALVKASDPEAVRFSKGHAYFEVERWDRPDALLVRLHGHTDSPPVQCFVLRYNMTRAGNITKVSRRVTEAGRSFCDE